MSKVDRLFSPDQQRRISKAVDQAEGKTSGEIVPYVVAASDSYEGALWRGAVLGALLVSVATGFLQQYFDLWAWPIAIRWAIPPAIGAALGYLLAAAAPTLRRWLIPAEVLERRVRRRATVAFVEEEVFRTRERTGILLFVSLFEHRVVVLGDEGINRKVEAREWEEIVDELVEGIRQGRAGDAMVDVIGKCGVLLERRGVEVRPDDENELADGLRRRDE